MDDMDKESIELGGKAKFAFYLLKGNRKRTGVGKCQQTT
jgi:hypothetical protein